MSPATELDVFACPLDGVSLIEASAGTGKTWNLCALYLRLLLERGLGVSQILVVTFTKAATAELRTRIRARLADTLARLEGSGRADPFVDALLTAVRQHGAGDDTRLRLHLDNAVHSFDEAAIFTIHGFCQRALADTPFAAGLPFAYTVTPDDPELCLQAVADFWRREVAAAPLPEALARWLVAQRDSPAQWAQWLRLRLAKPLATLHWPHAPADAIDSLATEQATAYRRARSLWSAAVAQTLRDGLAQLKGNIYREEGVAKAVAAWQTWFERDTPHSPGELDGKLELLGADKLAASVKKGGVAPQHAFFAAAQTVLDAQARLQAACEAARIALLQRMFEVCIPALRASKREQRLLAYDDMLYNLHQALSNPRFPWLAGALRARYPAALIDEFQDTDPLQFAVFERIYRPAGRSETSGPLFLLGDPKQAIYSFRNADLHTYLRARAAADAHYTLSANQRSTSALIEACNALFACNPKAFVLDGLHYTPVHAGSKPRPSFTDHTGTHAALRLWQLPPQADALLTRSAALAASADATASEIARLLAAGAAEAICFDARGLAAGDIAVLVRSHAQAGRIKAALAHYGIGSVELAQTSVFASPEAEELERVLIGVREPTRISTLLAALSTSLLGLSAAELAALAADEAALQARLSQASTWRDTWLTRGVGVMLRQWMADEGLSSRLLRGPDGERRLTNLLHLVECLHAAGEQHPAPDALLRWLAQSRREALDGAGDEATQLRLESDRRLVQIVTIHKAKGLEYPVVFCPFLWDGFAINRRDTLATAYADAQGQGVLDFRAEAAADPAIQARLAAEQAAEDVRLIYVALTRAVFRCYLVTGCYAKPVAGGVSTGESSRSLLNWLGAGAGLAYADWRDAKRSAPDVAGIEAAWAALATHPHIDRAPLPSAAPDERSIPAEAAPERAPLPAPAHIAEPWRIGSFSRLAQGAHADSDHDGLVAPPRVGAPPEALAPDDILRFPRGPRAGDCIHAVFESADFSDPTTWPEAIAQALRAHPQARDADDTEANTALLARQLARLLDDTLNTPLPLPDGGALRLRDIGQTARLTELGFFLTAGSVHATTLNRWLHAQGYAGPTLNFRSLQGYLSGFIDLIFRHAGRYYVLDWKSNLLGFEPAAYAQERLAQAMADNGYHLQHLLYTVALQRYLRTRLPDYDAARHLGGVFYLFVRGVRPQWGDAGIFAQAIEPGVIDSLDALLGGTP